MLSITTKSPYALRALAGSPAPARTAPSRSASSPAAATSRSIPRAALRRPPPRGRPALPARREGRRLVRARPSDVTVLEIVELLDGRLGAGAESIFAEAAEAARAVLGGLDHRGRRRAREPPARARRCITSSTGVRLRAGFLALEPPGPLRNRSDLLACDTRLLRGHPCTSSQRTAIVATATNGEAPRTTTSPPQPIDGTAEEIGPFALGRDSDELLSMFEPNAARGIELIGDPEAPGDTERTDEAPDRVEKQPQDNGWSARGLIGAPRPTQRGWTGSVGSGGPVNENLRP